MTDDAMIRRDRTVQIAVNTNGYERLQELAGENSAECHACICGIAYAIADSWGSHLMMDDRVPVDELQALATESLDGLPREALAASVRYLAKHLLAAYGALDDA
jgi:hypothetical protein